MKEGGIKAIIDQDLRSLQRERRRHFALALVLACTVIGTIVIVGVRPDLLAQPTWQLTLQFVLWLLCLVAFPAIGVGLLFPGRTARITLVVVSIAISTMAATGWPVVDHGHWGWGGIDQCITVVLGSGVLLLGLGFLSGAFVQRRRSTAVYWIAAGLTLAALNVVTWVCPEQDLTHVLPSHVGGAAVLLLLAVMLGFAARKLSAREAP